MNSFSSALPAFSVSRLVDNPHHYEPRMREPHRHQLHGFLPTERNEFVIIVLMGVAGSGKTTIGRILSDILGWDFFDGDDFHPVANVEKMRAGIPLNDDDRDTWLAALRSLTSQKIQQSVSAIIACSALKEKYRQRLQAGDGDLIRFVYLKGEYTLIQKRLQSRENHFMNPHLLASQFETLEEPKDILTIDIGEDPLVIVESILQGLGLQGQSGSTGFL